MTTNQFISMYKLLRHCSLKKNHSCKIEQEGNIEFHEQTIVKILSTFKIIYRPRQSETYV